MRQVAKNITSFQREDVPRQGANSALTEQLLAVHPATDKDRRKVVRISSLNQNQQQDFEVLAVRVASQKDKQAFAALFAHFAPRLKSYLLKHQIEPELAEELAQEVMITFWRKAELFNPGKAKFSTWIFRVARNRLIDNKRRKKYPEVSADEHINHMIAPERTDAELEQKQDSVLVSQAMKNLSETQRQAIELSFFEEMSHSQISEYLSIPLGTVKSRIRIAFSALRRELGDRR